jgi:hypothetical protein
LNLTDAGGLSAGVYDLIDYGTTSGNVSSLGTPNGPTGFHYNLSDDGSLISLVVSDLLPGDFNSDGSVDSADFLIWRMNENTAVDLPNDNGISGMIGQAHYDLWRANFGQVAGGGTALPAATNAAVPELSSFALAIVVCGALGLTNRRRLRPRG